MSHSHHQRWSDEHEYIYDYELVGDDDDDEYYPQEHHIPSHLHHQHVHGVNGHPPSQGYYPPQHGQALYAPSQSQSPTSLEQYAMFPGTNSMRSTSATPSQPMSPTQFGTPSTSPTVQYQNYPYSYPSHPSHSAYPSSGSGSGSGSGSNTSDQSPPHGKKFACSLCKLAFERRYDLKRHMHTHSDQKEFKCPKCEKGLARHDSLMRHLTVCKGPKA